MKFFRNFWEEDKAEMIQMRNRFNEFAVLTDFDEMCGYYALYVCEDHLNELSEDEKAYCYFGAPKAQKAV